MSKLNKKGVSLMVAYVLLIVIGISLATIVYPFLKQYAPFEKEVCPQDVSLNLVSLSCNISSQTLSLNITNRGYFTVKGVYIKMGNLNQSALTQINRGSEFRIPIKPISENRYIYPQTYNIHDFLNNTGLLVPSAPAKDFIVKMQPAFISKRGRPILCDSLTTQLVTCTH